MGNYPLQFSYDQWTNPTTLSANQFMYTAPVSSRRSGFGFRMTARIEWSRYRATDSTLLPFKRPQGRTVFLTADQVGVFANSWKTSNGIPRVISCLALESILMAEQFKNLASTTLSGDIDDTTTSVGVASAMGFTGGDFRILIDSEIMKVTGVSGTTFTVARHQEGTNATAHDNGAAVKHVLTAGGAGRPRPKRPGGV